MVVENIKFNGSEGNHSDLLHDGQGILFFNNSLSKPVKVERDDPSLKSVKNKKSMFEAAMNGGDNNMNYKNRNEVGSFGGGNRPFVKLKKTIFGGWNFVL